ncbi:MAG TPA: DNA gyrase subunit A [Myxococcota bacterium]|mgnify:FL=1|jgi:DNA gyrase subunit A|nr:DNA gyrase subunit A [Myxococcota bacterium]HON25144.1 DNA gyrase subunit A [Myxococcota bacterium]HOS61537.1 DNA gyrase subunit A [Myxococcota bacterium]HPC91280.1 DNA gyrase subunit A [Myxococcota bacterium]HPL24670.1 DNA gyrase subunit A [Myxococcota bacterium]
MAEEIVSQIVPVNIEDEMRTSYMDYAMSVIIGRALPDARDGLKPVHRRVLYTMHETKSFHNSAYKKSARIVGDVMGKYHPHGDAAIYDTMVRMAQDFSMRYLLVDGQGNFGSVDGDSAAAMRYTEVRMTRIAEEMLADIEKDTVDMVPNYDGSLTEPAVLPSRIPQLLINGSSGIAVGMSTNIPPHNLDEVVSGTIALIRNPELTVADLMEHIPAPDFPTGGLILGNAGIKAAYETGRGAVRMQARATIEEEKKGERAAIIVTEIPYLVNKAKLLERIAELHKDKKIEGIHDLRDESDREGMRIVIELKRDADAQVILNQLYSMTAMQSSFNVIMLAISRGRPILLTLKDALLEFINHRKDVVTRRSLYELRKAKEREHILLGYQIAIDNLDEVIALIRASRNPEEARNSLMERFGLTEIQAKAILDLRLERLTRMERDKILLELEEIRKTIARLEEILGSEAVLMDVIVGELEEIRTRYGDKRRSELTEDLGEIDIEDLIPEEDMVVTVSAQGFIKRTASAVFRSQRRGGKGKAGMQTREEDFVTDMFVASTHTWVIFFTDKGRAFRRRVYQIPEGSRTSKGRAMVNLLSLAGDERVRAILAVDDFNPGPSFVFATKKGVVKRTEVVLFKNIRASGLNAIRLDPDDDLISVRLANEGEHILLFTKQGKSIRFAIDDLRSIGRDTRGVRGMTLKSDDCVVGMEVLTPGRQILAVTDRGYAKRTEADEYRIQRRGGTGILAMRTNSKVGYVVGMRSVIEEDEIILTSSKGTTIRVRVSDISLIGRVTQGVRAMNVADDEQLVAIDVVVDKDDEQEETSSEPKAPLAIEDMD